MSTEWEQKLRRGGYRITPQRQLVLESVERLGHGTPEEILTEVQRTATGVNLSTVYRNLEVLEEVGLVTHAHIGHGAPTYHSVDDHVHIHLVCDRCGTVESVDATIADPFLDELRTRTGFVTDVSHVALHGTCSGCSTASS
ncbi:MAG TPA: Fur family transcriptional regulator [Candidatus Nanopelagicales bacterium]